MTAGGWHTGFIPFLMLTIGSASTALASPLTLYYENRPPFMTQLNGELGGTEGRPAVEAFKSAGIEFTLSEAPVSRQIELIGKNQGPSCAVGLYWTATRAKSGKYTSAIFRSLPQDAVMRIDNPKTKHIDSFAALLADPTISLALRNSYSYGPHVDTMLEHAKAKLKRPPENSHGRIKMVLEGIADATLFTQEEADFQIRQFGEKGKLLFVKHFRDTPPGETRHLYCSNSVGDTTINKLNAVIKK